jgi:BMFP domain-containing protein YqiC
MSPNNNKQSKIIDDISQLAGGAAGLLNGVQQQIRDDIQARVDEMATRMNLVPRDDFERLEALVEKLVSENTELKARIEKLEK